MNTRIRQLRKSLKLTQAQFASMIGLSQNYITLVESGDRSPSDRTVADICRVFSISQEWLRTGKGDMYAVGSRSAVAEQFGELAARKDPIIDGFIQFLSTRTPEQLKTIAQQLHECVACLDALDPNKAKED